MRLKYLRKNRVLVFSMVGYFQEEIKVDTSRIVNVPLKADANQLSELVVIGYGTQKRMSVTSAVSAMPNGHKSVRYAEMEDNGYYPPFNTEEYATVHENTFLDALKNPLSTFSIDVDNASYSNMRRFINDGQKPPKDAVRIEEMINYFTYDYPQPEGEDPFSITTEAAECPWNKEHLLVHIGLQGKKIATDNLPPSNLVFLIDVSGSMDVPNKLPLLKSAFKLLVNELRPQDHISLVVYAGAAGVVLPSTSGAEKDKILAAIEQLEAGGSTAGGAGIKLAYKLAEDNFKNEGNNRVILATDGDFNIGASSNAEMERLIEEKRESGVFLTVLGFRHGQL